MPNPQFNTLSLQPAAITSAGVLGPTTIDTQNTDWLFFHLNVGATATFVVEASYDNTNWDLVPLANLTSGALPALSGSTSGQYVVQTGPPLHRIRATAVTGTLTLRGGVTDVVNGSPLTMLTGSSALGIVPSTTSTGSLYALTSSTNANLIKAGSVALGQLDMSNYTAATMYVKLFNKATAPVPGTDIPILSIQAATGATAVVEFGVLGKRFPLGLGFCVTAGGSATDTTALTAVSGTAVGFTWV